jgi:hypothetical protein
VIEWGTISTKDSKSSDPESILDKNDRKSRVSCVEAKPHLEDDCDPAGIRCCPMMHGAVQLANASIQLADLSSLAILHGRHHMAS